MYIYVCISIYSILEIQNPTTLYHIYQFIRTNNQKDKDQRNNLKYWFNRHYNKLGKNFTT